MYSYHHRSLPSLIDAGPSSTAEAHGQVREWLEQATNTNPYATIDWQTYQTVLSWTSRADYLPIVEEVLKRRLALTGPAAYKATLLAQALPPASLVPLIDPLKALAAPPENTSPSHLNMIAQVLLDTAEKTKADTDKAKAESDEKYRWETWCGLYGLPLGQHSYPPLPGNPEWGMWGLVPVSGEVWWTVPKEEEKKD